MKYATLYLTRDHWHGLPAAAGGAELSGPREGEDGLTLSGVDAWLGTLVRRTPVRVLLSAASLAMACTPWSTSGASASALRRDVLHYWDQRLGEGHGHTIRIQWPRYGMPVLSLAWPQGLLGRLGEQLGSHGIQALGCGVFTALQASGVASPARALLLFGESDGYCALHLQDGEPVGMEQLPLDGSGLDAFVVWLRRKQLEYPQEGSIVWRAASDGAAPRMQEVLA